MGIGLVLIFWAIIGTILAGIGAIFFGGFTALITRGVKGGRRKAILLGSGFPFACFAWAGSVFVFQAIVNVDYLHRDPSLGDAWFCPLPNGYAIEMIDVTEQGCVYNPKTQRYADSVSSQDDAVFGVRVLQVTPQYILGGLDSKAIDHLNKDTDAVDEYFVLDTHAGKTTHFPTLDALGKAAEKTGIQLKLEPILAVYSHYRGTSWFDTFSIFLLLTPPPVVFYLLVRRIIRLRRTRETRVATP